MLSYVISPQDTSASNSHPMREDDDIQQVPSPPRDLTLHLSSLYNRIDVACDDKLRQNSQALAAEVDVLFANVAESCNERTRLLSDHTNPKTSRIENQCNKNIISNNNSFNMINNDNHNVNVNLCIEVLSDGAVTKKKLSASVLELDSRSLHQSSSSPQQTMTTIINNKQKLSKIASNKTVGLKRVSFGSSKGSMVETLVFETPTPLSEHVETSHGFISESEYKPNLDDSGIDIQEESERSIVRVSIYQSNQPQQIFQPEYFMKFEDNLVDSPYNYNCKLEDIMTAASPICGYDRQESTDSGWDNPFRPGGDLSREADEIVKMISGGQPITPTDDHVIGNGKSQTNDTAANGTIATENIINSNVSHNQSAHNGTNGTHRIPASAELTSSGAIKPIGLTSSTHVSKQVVPGPTSASHVTIDDKKKKKGCCIVQ